MSSAGGSGKRGFRGIAVVHPMRAKERMQAINVFISLSPIQPSDPESTSVGIQAARQSCCMSSNS